jgi:uncharacterized damage-inducible protein DinB
MKTITRLSLLLLALSQFTVAQTHNPPTLTTNQVMNSWVTNSETHLVPLANAMPADKYSFAPKNGEFKNVRTFGEQVKHLAACNYHQAALILGVQPTPDQITEQGPDSVKTKAEIMDYLKESYVYLHKAVAAINQNNQSKPIPGFSGTWQQARLGRAILAVAHSFNHYGQLVEYLRMNGIVPPDSR